MTIKRPSTASAGLTFLKEGYSIELAADSVNAFLRYLERAKIGITVEVEVEQLKAVIKPQAMAMSETAIILRTEPAVLRA
jgi:hypothetical protein